MSARLFDFFMGRHVRQSAGLQCLTDNLLLEACFLLCLGMPKNRALDNLTNIITEIICRIPIAALRHAAICRFLCVPDFSKMAQ
jgi:hypothetical protein